MPEKLISAEQLLEGMVFSIHKPLHWTSFQVVNKLKWVLKKNFTLPKKFKIGHAGTLDPLADGLLIICTGKKTKEIETYQSQPKTYTGCITLGATTPSFDLETEINQTFSTEHITHQKIVACTKTFIGEIVQKPPLYSAVKKDGERLYNIARKGETTEIPSKIVHIYRFDIQKIDDNKVHFEVQCSKGTYIRSLANDFGLALQSGAYLSALTRTQIGEFSLEKAQTIVDFENQFCNSPDINTNVI